MSGSDPCGTRNADSNGRLKRSRTSEDESERRGLEAGVRLDVDKHAGGALRASPAYLYTSTNTQVLITIKRRQDNVKSAAPIGRHRT